MNLKKILEMNPSIYDKLLKSVYDNKVEWFGGFTNEDDQTTTRKGKVSIDDIELKFSMSIKINKLNIHEVKFSIYEDDEYSNRKNEANLSISVKDNKEDLSF